MNLKTGNFGRLLVISCLLLAAGSNNILAQDNTAALEAFNKAQTERSEGKIDDAIISYKIVLDEDPNYVDAYINLGQIYFERKDYAQAVLMFTTATEKDSQNVDAFANLGRVHYKMAQYPKAAEDFIAALALDENKAELYGELGRVYYRQKNYKELITVLEKGHALGAADHLTQFQLGKAYQKTSQTSKAIAAYKASLKIKANYNSQSALGSLYLSQKKYQPAASAFKAALKINPKKYLASMNYAVAMEQLNQDAIDANVANWQSFVNLAKNNPKAKSNVAIAEQHIKELKERKAKLDLQ